jgi:hypothetical protein
MLVIASPQKAAIKLKKEPVWSLDAIYAGLKLGQ